MTICIALKDENKKRIILGTDTQTQYGNVKSTKNPMKEITIEYNITDGYNQSLDKKTFNILFSGYVWISDYIKYSYKTPPKDKNITFEEYLYNNFFMNLKEELIQKRILEFKGDVPDTDSQFIVIHDTDIYYVFHNFTITKELDDYAIIGSGSELALGSLLNNLKYHQELDKKEIVKHALEICGDNLTDCNNNPQIKILYPH